MGLRGAQETAMQFLKDYPMTPKSNKETVQESRIKAVNTILSNQTKGKILKVRNISKEPGRTVLLNVFNHMVERGIIARTENTVLASEIEYLKPAKLYVPTGIVYTPRCEIFYKIGKKGGRFPMNLDTPEKKQLAARLNAWWAFIERQKILTNISHDDFELLNRYQTEILRKEPLNYPEQERSKPYFSFNDKEMTKGGRLYGAWWIGTHKLLRKFATINGELTADVDGCGMHVQLLYKIAGVEFPSQDPYIYEDERRAVTKGLMLLMMNTRRDYHDKAKGREAVANTYRRNKIFPKTDRSKLLELIKELEHFHKPIVNHLYKSNWGELQRREAQIMMNIMENGMRENIPVLPVHDGCLCPRSKKQRVLELFQEQGIKAAENTKHLKPIPLDEIRQLLRDNEKLKQAV